MKLLLVIFCLVTIACVTTRNICQTIEPITTVDAASTSVEEQSLAEVDAGDTQELDASIVQEDREQAEREAARFDPLNGDL